MRTDPCGTPARVNPAMLFDMTFWLIIVPNTPPEKLADKTMLTALLIMLFRIIILLCEIVERAGALLANCTPMLFEDIRLAVRTDNMEPRSERTPLPLLFDMTELEMIVLELRRRLTPCEYDPTTAVLWTIALTQWYRSTPGPNEVVMR